MSALVRAELLKLRTVALPFWLLLTTLVFVLLGVLVLGAASTTSSVPSPGSERANASGDDVPSSGGVSDDDGSGCSEARSAD